MPDDLVLGSILYLAPMNCNILKVSYIWVYIELFVCVDFMTKVSAISENDIDNVAYTLRILYLFNRRELDITEIELAAIAPAARAGLRNPYCPSTGCSNVGTELVTKIG